MRRLFIWSVGLLIALAGASAARADELSVAETKNVRAVVQAQLDAFAADDANRAFSFAAPSLREVFGSAEKFMAMVRSSYPVVYRPVSVAFLVPEAVGAEVVQGVHFTDGRGGLWLAIYHLQRQRDNSWRISGCQLVESRATTT